MKRFRKLFIILAWVVSLTALFYGGTNWYAHRKWEAFKTKFEQEVGSLTLEDYVPKPVPDSNNFALNPASAAWMTNWRGSNYFHDHDNFIYADKLVGGSTKTNERGFSDLPAYAEAFDLVLNNRSTKGVGQLHTDDLTTAKRLEAAPKVLKGLQDDDSTFDALRAAMSLTQSRFPLEYDKKNPWAILLPHLGKIRGACQYLRLRGSAELALRKTDAALADIQLMLRLQESIQDEPIIISVLSRAACFHLAEDCIWEGLAEHRWTDSQLSQLQAWLEPIHFLNDAARSLHAECAVNAKIAAIVKDDPAFLNQMEDLGLYGKNAGSVEAALYLMGRVAPSGWLDFEAIHLLERYQTDLDGILDKPPITRVDPQRVRTLKIESGNDVWTAFWEHRLLTLMFSPSVGKFVWKVTEAEENRDLTLTACALERYRLANGHVPDRLEQLVPTYLSEVPMDHLSGQPLLYEKSSADQFNLRSVGWDIKELDNTGPAHDFINSAIDAHWSWHYPANN